MRVPESVIEVLPRGYLPGPRTSRRISLINPVNFIPFLKTWADWPVNPLAEYDQYLQAPDLRLSRAWSSISVYFVSFCYQSANRACEYRILATRDGSTRRFAKPSSSVRRSCRAMPIW
jgi:hypothetical protein